MGGGKELRMFRARIEIPVIRLKSNCPFRTRSIRNYFFGLFPHRPVRSFREQSYCTCLCTVFIVNIDDPRGYYTCLVYLNFLVLPRRGRKIVKIIRPLVVPALGSPTPWNAWTRARLTKRAGQEFAPLMRHPIADGRRSNRPFLSPRSPPGHAPSATSSSAALLVPPRKPRSSHYYYPSLQRCDFARLLLITNNVCRGTRGRTWLRGALGGRRHNKSYLGCFPRANETVQLPTPLYAPRRRRIIAALQPPQVCARSTRVGRPEDKRGILPAVRPVFFEHVDLPKLLRTISQKSALL